MSCSVLSHRCPPFYLYWETNFLTASTYFFWASAALRSLYSAHFECFALPCERKISRPSLPYCMTRWRIRAYLEVEHARLRGVLELGVLGALLEQSIDLHNTQYGQRCSSLQLAHREPISLTSRSSSLLGVLESERLSLTAWANSGDWATMLVVKEVCCLRFRRGFDDLMFCWESCCRRGTNRQARCTVLHFDVICSEQVRATPIKSSGQASSCTKPRGHVSPKMMPKAYTLRRM